MSSSHPQVLISVKIDSTIAKFPIYHWTQVLDLKSKIFQLCNIPISDQRLYLGHIELLNSYTLDDYSLFNLKKTRGLVLEYTKLSGTFIRKVPGAFCDSSLQQNIQKANQGLKMNFTPQLTWDGTAGVYLIRDAYKTVQGVFKPIDEEAFAPQNPRGHVGKLLSNGIRPGVKSGEGTFREIAAYLLDYKAFVGVPKTALVESQHPNYRYGLEKVYPKKGSFQEFVENKGAIEDFGVTIFAKFEVQKIAMLDLRILNMDRNEGNILVSEGKKLVPIDHSLSMPDCLEICDYDLCWMNFPQCKEKIEESILKYISELNELKDITLIKDTMPISDKSLMNLRVSCLLLKKGACLGLTLQQIGSLLCRSEDGSSQSVIEQVINKSIELHKSIQKSLNKILKLEKRFSTTPVIQRTRAYSNDDEEEMFKDSVRAETEETRPIFVTIGEVDEDLEENEDLESIPVNMRSHSLPCLEKIGSKNSKTDQDLAFDQKLFYYIESFLFLAIQRKVKEVQSI